MTKRISDYQDLRSLLDGHRQQYQGIQDKLNKEIAPALKKAKTEARRLFLTSLHHIEDSLEPTNTFFKDAKAELKRQEKAINSKNFQPFSLNHHHQPLIEESFIRANLENLSAPVKTGDQGETRFEDQWSFKGGRLRTTRPVSPNAKSTTYIKNFKGKDEEFLIATCKKYLGVTIPAGVFHETDKKKLKEKLCRVANDLYQKFDAMKTIQYGSSASNLFFLILKAVDKNINNGKRFSGQKNIYLTYRVENSDVYNVIDSQQLNKHRLNNLVHIDFSKELEKLYSLEDNNLKAAA